MQETPEDIAALQDLLDRSHAAGGRHLRSIITPERRGKAADPVEGLPGGGLPRVGPRAARGRPLRARPQVSATPLPGEELCVTVHGTAVPVDVQAGGFRQALLDIYVPRF